MRLIIFLLPFLISSILSLAAYPKQVICSEKEKRALLNFKVGLKDPSNRLSSWSENGGDCCQWAGVRCNNATGQVTGLFLRNPCAYNPNCHSSLGGKITSSLLELEFLSQLDLSENDFNGSSIPVFLGSMGSLTYLNLYLCYFAGMIPHQLGNLSSLRDLDLSLNYGLYSNDLSWMAGLRSLEYLDMSTVNLQEAINWFQAVSMLSLSELYLSSCYLEKFTIKSIPANFTSLRVLDLNSNNLDCPIPYKIAQLKHLERLDLGNNSLYGHIPQSLGNLSSLSELYVSDNHLSGPIPQSLRNLSSLSIVSLSSNSLSGNISEADLAKLQKLKHLDISHNSLYFQIDPNWVPSFQLDALDASECPIGPNFPQWLRTQTSLITLQMSYSRIFGPFPNWLWDFSSHLHTLDIHGNQISGDLSNILLNVNHINLASNKFTGHVPRLYPNVEVVDLSNNSLSGEISTFFCREEHRKNNLLSLDLSNNTFSGHLPSECLVYWQSLGYMNLGRNNLSGYIPDSIGFLSLLLTLQLHNNNLIGNIPLPLKNCTNLVILNLAKNQLTGVVPYWIANMISLAALKLRSNNFSGNIPLKIWQLPCLIILDMANNHLSGHIPNNISLPAMTNPSENFYVALLAIAAKSLNLYIKRRESDYEEIVQFVRSIDISNNNLSGLIPAEISTLAELLFLNLSTNQFKGKIPEQFGGMTKLQALDLSRNHLSDEIPPSLSNLTFLNDLDLSYNNLSGQIPLGAQLQTFEETSYIGNDKLCGAPLRKNCTRSKELSKAPTPAKEEDADDLWFYIGMGCGFVVAYLGVWSVLFFKKTWRHAYFRFVEDMKDKIYVTTLVKTKQLRIMLKRSKSN